MTEVKRSISQVGGADLRSNDGKKLHSKPGRKPVDTEPKSKRTAQNRAAQRAYRERKERKMQDLEDKVKMLEDENLKAATETDFLRAQVEILKVELARYRSEHNSTDLMLPTKVGKLSKPVTGGYVPNFEYSTSSSSSNKSDRLSLSGSIDNQSNTSPRDNLTADFPWYQKNLTQQMTVNSSSNDSSTSNNTSPLNDNLLVSPDSSVGVSVGIPPQNSIDNQLDFTSFEEQVDPFCMKLNEACGTKECPIPKSKQDSFPNTNDFNFKKSSVLNEYPKENVDIQQYSSPFSNLVSPNSGNTNFVNEPFFIENSEDPLKFLNDNNFDVDLAFSNRALEVPKQNEFDPISLLTTEESIYDPTKNEDVDVNFNFNEFVKSSLEEPNQQEKPKEDEDVVPAPPRVMKCSEIWDRISSHPRYSEIDIDGLCNELKSKAKCSEKGVVINSSDVNFLIEQSAILKSEN
jgi:AP-1-like factor